MTTRVRLGALLIAPLLALAACGGSDEDSDGGSDGIADRSATQILAAAKKQLAEEEFISVKGTGTNDDEDTSLEVDLGFAGDTAAGAIVINGLQIELLKADGTSYFKASDEFYRSSAGASADRVIALIDGRWVVADPEDDDFGDIASFVTKDQFFDELLDPDSEITKTEEKKVNGVDCIGLEADKSTFWFDVSDGKPVSLVMSEQGDGSLNFTYDEIDEAEAPAAEDVVDLKTLAG